MTTPEDGRDAGTGWPSEATALPDSTTAPLGPVVEPAPADPLEPVVEPAPADPLEPVVEPAPADSLEPVEEPADQFEPPVDPRTEAAESDPAAAVAAERSSRSARSGLRSAPVLALLLTTILMAVATGFVWYQVHQHTATESARRAGLETSRDAARVLFSYDYRTLSKDFAAGKAITTGTFQKQYADTTSKVVTPVAIDKKAVVKADVVTAGVVRATPGTVVTIVFVNQVTTSSLSSGPKVDLSRVRMTLMHVRGRWLVSKVEAL